MVSLSGVASYDYEAFGTKYSPNTTELINQRYQYAGRETSKVSGLNNHRYRFADPLTGRWTARDPIGYYGGIGLYGYVNNSPVSHSDNYGLIDSGTLAKMVVAFLNDKGNPARLAALRAAWAAANPVQKAAAATLLEKTTQELSREGASRFIGKLLGETPVIAETAAGAGEIGTVSGLGWMALGAAFGGTVGYYIHDSLDDAELDTSIGGCQATPGGGAGTPRIVQSTREFWPKLADRQALSFAQSVCSKLGDDACDGCCDDPEKNCEPKAVAIEYIRRSTTFWTVTTLRYSCECRCE